MIVYLFGGKSIVVDVKVFFIFYFEVVVIFFMVFDVEFVVCDVKFKLYVKVVWDYIFVLGFCSYWDGFEFSLEMVIVFILSELFFLVVFEVDLMIMEFVFLKNVVFVLFVMLFLVLKVVVVSWWYEVVM